MFTFLTNHKPVIKIVRYRIIFLVLVDKKFSHKCDLRSFLNYLPIPDISQ